MNRLNLFFSAYYAIDPEAQRVIHTGELPATPRRRAGGLLNRPVGPEGLLYGIGAGGELFTIDPDTHEVSVVAQHETRDHARGAAITPGGILYYGSGATLMRCRLGREPPNPHVHWPGVLSPISRAPQLATGSGREGWGQ